MRSAIRATSRSAERHRSRLAGRVREVSLLEDMARDRAVHDPEHVREHLRIPREQQTQRPGGSLAEHPGSGSVGQRPRAVGPASTYVQLYFGQDERSNVDGAGDELKAQILEEGRVFVRALADEGNTDEGFEQAFDVLGDLGLYMASLRRHELTNPAREERSPHEEATALGLHIGASVGVAPRFATSHLATHNLARDGRQKSFTALPTSSSSSTTTPAASSRTCARPTR